MSAWYTLCSVTNESSTVGNGVGVLEATCRVRNKSASSVHDTLGVDTLVVCDNVSNNILVKGGLRGASSYDFEVPVSVLCCCGEVFDCACRCVTKYVFGIYTDLVFSFSIQPCCGNCFVSCNIIDIDSSVSCILKMFSVFAMLESFPVFSCSDISLGRGVIVLHLIFVILLSLRLLVIRGRWASCVCCDGIL